MWVADLKIIGLMVDPVFLRRASRGRRLVVIGPCGAAICARWAAVLRRGPRVAVLVERDAETCIDCHKCTKSVTPSSSRSGAPVRARVRRLHGLREGVSGRGCLEAKASRACASRRGCGRCSWSALARHLGFAKVDAELGHDRSRRRRSRQVINSGLLEQRILRSR